MWWTKEGEEMRRVEEKNNALGTMSTNKLAVGVEEDTLCHYRGAVTTVPSIWYIQSGRRVSGSISA